jgi:small conductance mechanosensitive channel
VGRSIERDPQWGPLVLEPLEIAGVESIDGGLVTIRARFKVLPLNQGRLASELRRRLLGAFVGRGIRPYAG